MVWRRSATGSPTSHLHPMIALRYHRAVTPDAVRKLRQRLGLSQSKFAALLGVHKVSVAKWEVGLLGMSATTDCLLRVLAQQGTAAVPPPTKPRRASTRRRRGR